MWCMCDLIKRYGQLWTLTDEVPFYFNHIGMRVLLGDYNLNPFHLKK
jgi:hypothetical protein